MSQSTRTKIQIMLVVLIVAMMGTQASLDPQIRDIHKGEKTALAGLSGEFILGPLLGMQEAVAGLLWVRADEFFHEGDYDAILPIVRMVTWLDPHQLDVYITGAWHLSYNFTDSSERSDRRYIPAAQKLLEEGNDNNPLSYDIPFELGWENIDKIKDYARAEKWYRVAVERKSADDNGKLTRPAPMFVWHQLAHALERQGKIDEAIEIWRKSLAMSEIKVKDNPKDFSIKSVHDSELHNLELNLSRKYSRYVHEIDYNLPKSQTMPKDLTTGEPAQRSAYLASDAARDGVPVGQPRLPATARPWDVAFDAHVKFDAPKKMTLSGTFNVGDGARVSIRLADADFRETQQKTFTFDIDQSQTILVDQHSVRSGTWGRPVDMSKDPKMYSFSRSSYYLVLEFDPRGTSPFIQDKFGWSGEGMTDKKYLVVKKSTMPGVPDNRIIRKVFKLSKSQILGTEPVTEANVVPNDEYDRIQAKPAATD